MSSVCTPGPPPSCPPPIPNRPPPRGEGRGSRRRLRVSGFERKLPIGSPPPWAGVRGDGGGQERGLRLRVDSCPPPAPPGTSSGASGTLPDAPKVLPEVLEAFRTLRKRFRMRQKSFRSFRKRFGRSRKRSRRSGSVLEGPEGFWKLRKRFRRLGEAF